MLTAEQKIERAHVSIMQSKRFRFFSGMTMVGKVYIDDDVPTARTNGRDIWYGRAFVDALNHKQLLFVVLHELSHMAWRHTTVWKHLYKKDPCFANAACDFVINLQLYDQDTSGEEIQFPTKSDGTRMGLLDEKYRGWDAQQVFNDLVKQAQKKDNNKGEGGSEEGTGEGGGTRKEKDQFDEHDWDGEEQLTETERQDLEGRIIRALQQGKHLVGKMGGEVNRSLIELVQPEVDWRDVLRDCVKTICKGNGDSSWRRFSKKFLGSGVYMPQNIDSRIGWVVDCIDTSGSIGDELLSKFLTEIKSICNELSPEGLHNLYWDTRVAGHEVYASSEYATIETSTKPVGGGGTDPACLPDYINEEITSKGSEPAVVVVLTDGYFHGEGNWSVVPCPVVWCVVGNPGFTAQNGKTIHIKE